MGATDVSFWTQKFRGNQMQDIKSSFEEEGGFPGVIEVVDGTHVRIRAPEHESEAYINRKKFHWINVQVLNKDTINYIGNTQQLYNILILKVLTWNCANLTYLCN